MPLHFVKDNVNIDFIGKRRFGYVASVVLILIALCSVLFGNGMRLGIDFAGGVIAQVKFEQPVADEVLKKSMERPDLPGLSTQRFGLDNTDFLLRFSQQEGLTTVQLRDRIEVALKEAFPDNAASIERMEVVGPKVGKDLTEKGLSALFYAILIIAVYISGRFEQRWMTAAIMAACLFGATYVIGLVGVSTFWLICACMAVTIIVCFVLRLNFALGAIVCLLHDVCIAVGVLSLMDIDVDLNVLAAILTIIGYSLNDTIIVYDRLRENLRLNPDKELGFLINRSINQTLARTVLTSGTTLAAALALVILGGGVIYSFALTMTVGVIIGTYSSIFVATPLLLALGNTEFYVRANQKVEYEKPGEHGIV